MPRYIMHNETPTTGLIELSDWGIIAHVSILTGCNAKVSAMLKQATAAADLLAALEMFVTIHTAMSSPSPSDKSYSVQECMDAARAAIAKAKGI